jgi:trimeric autotransporter adhesin
MPRYQAKLGSIGARCAALSLVLGTASTPASANLPMRTLRPNVPRPIAAAQSRPSHARRRSTSPPAPTQCMSENGSTNGDTFFVGVTGNSTANYAGGNDTAVLAGLSNEACDEHSAIGGGAENDIGNESYGNSSFIGAGSGNAITAGYAFVGGGNANEASSLFDFIGAGYDNYAALGGSAFVGAGGSEYATKAGFYGATTGSSNVADAIDTFVGAGDLNVITSQGNGSFIGGGGYFAASDGNSINNQISGVDSFIGAGDSNAVSGSMAFAGAGNANGATGASSFVGSGQHNGANGASAFVGAGANNYASGGNSFVGAGGGEEYVKHLGTVIGTTAGAMDSFIGAGDLNSVSGSGSFIGAGGYTYAATGATAAGNTISGTDSFIGAGDQNVVSGTEAFVGSGGDNSIGSKATYASIIGGNRNTASGEYASVIGGFGNTASGSYGIVAGGDTSTAAGTVSFAAGYHADAAHNGSFVWSDYVSGSKTIADTAANQFVVRASGGFSLYSNEAATSGVKLAPGSGTWASLSDRNAKTDVVPLDDASVLAEVATLPVSTWRYKSESGVRHVGPMAQDFYAAFGVGEDDRHIASIDEGGIELAAIKALKAKIERRNAQIAVLTRRVAKLEGGLK